MEVTIETIEEKSTLEASVREAARTCDWEQYCGASFAELVEKGTLTLACYQMSRSAGISIPVYLSPGLHADISMIPFGRSEESSEGRLWDVLVMGAFAMRRAKPGARELNFFLSLTRIPPLEGEEEAENEDVIIELHRYVVRVFIGPGIQDEPVVVLARAYY